MGFQRRSEPARAFVADTQQAQAIAHRGSSLLLVGGPGTGKTTTLIELAVDRIRSGHPVDRLLVLTYGRESAANLRDQIAIRTGAVTREPLARTIHSLCFGLLRRHAIRVGEPEPWLVSGPEHDSVIRDLLRGSVDEGFIEWPESLRLALKTRGFARELRDLLSRATERGLNPDELMHLAARRGRDDWRAVAEFYRDYLELQLLTGRNAVDPSALVVDTLAVLEDQDFLDEIRAEFPLVLVDEYQESDPSHRALIEMIASELVIALDPDSAVGRFRGAEPETALESARALTRSEITLAHDHRAGEKIHRVCTAVAARFRRSYDHRDRVLTASEPGAVDAIALRSLTAECRFIAQEMRRAHLLDAVPWSKMAVLVRAPGARVASLQRAFAAEGVPVAVDASALALADQPSVAPLITMARTAIDDRQLDAEAVESLLLSPYGGADPLLLRRLRQEFRSVAGTGSVDQILRDVVLGRDQGADLDAQIVAPARRIAALIDAARHAAARPGAQAENLFWAIWSSAQSPSGRAISHEWQEAALAGGLLGHLADRDLDAVVALFETAARFADRRPGSTPASFLDELDDLELPGDTIAARAQREDVVEILTVHSAKGREWDLVAVAGIQEGEFPNLRLRGSLLGSDLLVSVLRDPHLSDTEIIQGAYPALVDDERRLFHVAVSRTRRRLLLTAVVGDEDRASRFFEEVCEVEGVQSQQVHEVPRSLSMTGLVGELRRSDHIDAPVVLGRLLEAGVSTANPDHWWGLSPISSDEAIGERAVSPSTASTFEACALRWFLENHGGARESSHAQAVGIAVHSLAERMVTEQLDLPRLEAAFAEIWQGLDTSDGWVGEFERQQAWIMITKLDQWQRESGRKPVATEVPFDHEIAGVRVRGKIDRVDQTESGAQVLVDFKTGGSAITKKEAEQDAQLMLYQLAVREGAAVETLGAAEVAGAELVYLGTDTKSASVKTQASVDLDLARERLVTIADRINAAAFIASPSKECRVCAVRTSCPAVLSGRAVTE